jgi:hypothetical protein
VTCCPVIELRQYTLRPGQRDVLVELFDRELVETQEATGMHVVGQFRDLDRPDHFVWLRGFADMDRRHAALTAFYGGPVWKTHGPAAAATMVDSDDVLLLRPLVPFGTLPARPAVDGPASTVFVAVYPLDKPADDSVVELFDDPLAVLVTDPSENTFPALPVRDGEFLVVVGRSPGPATVPEAIGEPQRLRLTPTGRSQLR